LPDPAEVFALFKLPLLATALKLGLERVDLINVLLSDHLNLILINLELDEQVAVLRLSPTQLLLVQVDNHGEAVIFILHGVLHLCHLVLHLDSPLLLQCFLVGLVPFDFVQVGLLDAH